MGEQVEFTPDDDQLRTMRLAYGHFRDTGNWPIFQYVRMRAAEVGIRDAHEALRRLPISFVYPRRQLLNPDQEVRLTIPALAWLESAQHDVSLFLEVLQQFGAKLAAFEPSPSEVRFIQVTAEDMRARLPQVSDLELRKLFSLLDGEPLGSWRGHPADRPDEWYLAISPEEAARIGGVVSIQDYLRVRAVFPDERSLVTPSLERTSFDRDNLAMRGRSGRVNPRDASPSRLPLWNRRLFQAVWNALGVADSWLGRFRLAFYIGVSLIAALLLALASVGVLRAALGAASLVALGFAALMYWVSRNGHQERS
jgi:hypothetical protein